MMVGFILPYLDIKKPDKTEIIKEIIIKGSCTFAASIALPPNPDGGGISYKYRYSLVNHEH